MRLSKIQKLSDHSASELDILSKMTAGPYSGMTIAIMDIKNGYDKDRIFTLYYFRNRLNQRMGWLATVETPNRHEIWSFVVPKFRRKGCALNMFEIFVRKLTPKQRSFTYCVHGYHEESANRFYLKVKELYKNSMTLQMLTSYYS